MTDTTADTTALENLARTLGLTNKCPSSNGRGISCTQGRGHQSAKHYNEWASVPAWEDDLFRDQQVKAREVGRFLEPVIQHWKIGELPEAVGYAFVALLADLKKVAG